MVFQEFLRLCKQLPRSSFSWLKFFEYLRCHEAKLATRSARPVGHVFPSQVDQLACLVEL